MPIFEYICNDCGRGFEALALGGEGKAECPSCRKSNLRRKLSVFAVGAGSGVGAARSSSMTADSGGGGGGCGSCGDPRGPGACAMD